ncbi:hypothetical protein BVRB_8g188680 [Beta vulgaris subsp. vulgaris]|nr:hypothetical protein BVRB_8g188680 [Beta vulgaris subsp. vulgaris]
MVRKRGRTQSSNEPEVHEEPAVSEVMIDTMGLTRLNREQKVTWRNLCRSKRVVQCTKFIDTNFLAQLGLLDGFREMMGRAGLLGMLYYTPRTYKRCVYEFLSTITLVKHRVDNRIRFRMHDRVRDISMSQVREAFGWVAPSSDNPFVPMGVPSKEVGTFWYRISGLPLSSGGEKISSIRHPGLRMAAYFLGMTIFCKGETGKLNQLEMCYLRALLPGSVGIPDWADLWLKSCIDVRTKLGGHLSMGGQVTLLSEGCRGSLSEKIIREYKLRDKGKSQHQTYALGIKEVWEIDASKHQPGFVLHTLGWPLDNKTYGGSFLYHMKDNLVSIGLVVALNYQNPFLNPYEEFQKLKHHPAIKPMLEGGTVIQYGARTLNEGGFQE